MLVAYDPERHDRRSIRLRGYDYAQPGAYFVTLCVQGHVCLFGEVEEEAVRLNRLGTIAAKCWMWLEQQYAHVQLDAWVVMPNHLHGIVVLVDGDRGRGASRSAPTAPVPKRKPLGRLIGAFKTVSTKRINRLWKTPGERIWQCDFYERVIRNKSELHRIRRYIADNPLRWHFDRYHPDRA